MDKNLDTKILRIILTIITIISIIIIVIGAFFLYGIIPKVLSLGIFIIFNLISFGCSCAIDWITYIEHERSILRKEVKQWKNDLR